MCLLQLFASREWFFDGQEEDGEGWMQGITEKDGEEGRMDKEL
jgi:hypothetical protein